MKINFKITGVCSTKVALSWTSFAVSLLLGKRRTFTKYIQNHFSEELHCSMELKSRNFRFSQPIKFYHMYKPIKIYHMYIYIYIHVHVCVYVYKHVCMYECMYVCVYVWICMYVSTFVGSTSLSTGPMSSHNVYQSL